MAAELACGADSWPHCRPLPGRLFVADAPGLSGFPREGSGGKARPGKDSGSFSGNSGRFKSRCPQGPPGTPSAKGTRVRRGCLPVPAWHTQPQLIFGFLRRPRNDRVCGGLHPSTFSCLDVCRGPFRGPWTRGAAVQRGLNCIWPPSIARRVTLLLVVGITGSCFLPYPI